MYEFNMRKQVMETFESDFGQVADIVLLNLNKIMLSLLSLSVNIIYSVDLERGFTHFIPEMSNKECKMFHPLC